MSITIKFSKKEYFDLLSAIVSAECRARELRFSKISNLNSGTMEIDRFVKLYNKVSRYYPYD